MVPFSPKCGCWKVNKIFIKVCISLFWAKYYSHYSCLGYLVDFLTFTPFLAIYSVRIMTNLEETKMLKRCKCWFKMFPSLTKYSPASQNVPKPSLHLELWGRGLLMSPGVWGWLEGRGSWGHPGLIQPILLKLKPAPSGMNCCCL